MKNIEQAIKNYIAQEFMYDMPETALDSDLSLIQNGIIDSLGIFTLIDFIEGQFGVKIEPQDVILENFETINAIKSLVLSRQTGQDR